MQYGGSLLNGRIVTNLPTIIMFQISGSFYQLMMKEMYHQWIFTLNIKKRRNRNDIGTQEKFGNENLECVPDLSTEAIEELKSYQAIIFNENIQ